VADVAVEELLGSGLIDPERNLDLERVERYAQMLDDLPPVTVFRLPEGLLLADGYHRLAAARRLGRASVAATIMVGSTSDALRFATQLAMRERGLSEQQARDAIQRRSTSR
jgi:hypothetical protein